MPNHVPGTTTLRYYSWLYNLAPGFIGVAVHRRQGLNAHSYKREMSIEVLMCVGMDVRCTKVIFLIIVSLENSQPSSVTILHLYILL